MTNKNRIKISYTIVVLIIAVVFFYNYTFDKKTAYCSTPVPIDFTEKSFTDNYKEGRKLFKMLCASCHKLDKKMIGPALSNEDLLFNKFYEYLTIENNLISISNQVNKESNEIYLEGNFNHYFSQLSKENIEMIYNYVNMAN